MYQEKKELESITKKTVKANRSHYLAFSERLPIILNELGFIYDSSVVESKIRISNNTRGYFLLNNVMEFPITIMDAQRSHWWLCTLSCSVDTLKIIHYFPFCISGNTFEISKTLFLSVTTLIPPALATLA